MNDQVFPGTKREIHAAVLTLVAVHDMLTLEELTGLAARWGGDRNTGPLTRDQIAESLWWLVKRGQVLRTKGFPCRYTVADTVALREPAPESSARVPSR